MTSTAYGVRPCILQNGSSYYLAIRIVGSGHHYYMQGFEINLLASFTQINCTDANGTLPSGYSVKHEGNGSGIWGNASSATKLATARTIWGQSFNGEGNVSGSLSSVSGIAFSNAGHFALDAFGNFVATSTSTNSWNVMKSDRTEILQIKCDASLGFVNVTNFGIGTTSPAYKLDVLGNMRVGSTANSAGGDVLIELWRGTNASWRMLNAGGILKIQSNYTTAVTTYFDCVTLEYNTGHMVVKGAVKVTTLKIGSITLTDDNGKLKIDKDVYSLGEVSAKGSDRKSVV